MSNPIKIISIEGDLTAYNNSFKLTIPFNEADLQTGVWQVAVRDFSYQCATVQTNNLIFDVTSNLVWGYKYSAEQQTICKQLSLSKVVIRKSTFVETKTFHLIWYQVTLKSNNIIFQLEDSFRNKISNLIKIKMTILLQRMC